MAICFDVTASDMWTINNFTWNVHASSCACASAYAYASYATIERKDTAIRFMSLETGTGVRHIKTHLKVTN